MNIKKILGLAAVAGLLAIAVPTGRADAASLIQPGIAATIQDNAALTTEVQYRRHRHHRAHRHHGPRHHWHRGHGPRHYGHRHAAPRHYGFRHHGRRW